MSGRALQGTDAFVSVACDCRVSHDLGLDEDRFLTPQTNMQSQSLAVVVREMDSDELSGTSHHAFSMQKVTPEPHRWR